ncbi:MAG: 4Fe-4S binding protein [Promethearchaeota archaeon]|nr:MAG: 4Fe-4S binding protein [Candidatus Lokiarchaeota archaeon]
MPDADFDTYRNLQLHLDQFPIGFPATPTGIELKVLKHLFTEKEAIIATKLSWTYDNPENIYNRIDEIEISVEQLEEMLASMASKGTIKYKIENGKRVYANIPLAVGMFEYQVNKITKEFLIDFEEYLMSAFGAELVGSKLLQFRTIPIEQSINREQSIVNYNEIRKVVENVEEPIVVTNCLCRQSKDLLEDPCKKTSLRETCFYFGEKGQLFINEGWARTISRNEALKILEQAEIDGLALQSENTLKPEFMCCCCGCCCLILARLKLIPRPSRIITSNYYAEIDHDLCVGCGTCIDKCDLKSIKLIDNFANVILKRCIGCGVCVPTCSEQAIQLKKREEEKIPPKDSEDLYNKIMIKKQQLRKK